MAVAGNPRTGSSNHGPQSMTTIDGLYQCGITCTLSEEAIAWKRRIGATWTRAGTTCTVTTTSHGLTVGETIYLQYSSSSLAFGSGAKTIVATPTANTFTFTCANAGDASGTVDWTQTYDLTLITGNPLFKQGTDTTATMANFDDHHAFAFAVDDQGRCHIMGNTFHSELRYVRSAASGGIPNITSWTDARASLDSSATGGDAHTYYHMVRHSTGLIMAMDQRELVNGVVIDGLGNDRLVYRLPAGSGTTWSPLIGNGEFMVAGRSTGNVSANRAYLIGMVVDKNDRFHFAGIWRTNDEDPPIIDPVTGASTPTTSQKEPFYVYSDDLVNFYNAAGQPAAVPLYWVNRAQCRISSAPGFSPGYGNGIAIDGQGYPHIVLYNGAYDGSGALIDPVTGQTWPKWVECYWTGSAWSARAIYTSGSAYGPNLHYVAGELWLVSSSLGRAWAATLGWWNANPYQTRTGVRVYMGGPVDSTASPAIPGSRGGVVFEPNPDPTLINKGELCLNVADGDVPMSFSVGNHFHCNAAE